MYDAEALHSSAKRIRDAVWNLTPKKPALVARRWSNTEDGTNATARYLVQMQEAESDVERLLAMQILALRVEIASRKAGWCIEIDAG
jgi:hypothetical protein